MSCFLVLLVAVLVILAALGLAFDVIFGLLSFLGVWIIPLALIGLGAAIFQREQKPPTNRDDR